MPTMRQSGLSFEFLGYSPLPTPATFGDRLVRHRTTSGISQREWAKRLSVDPGTIAGLERGVKTTTSVLLNHLNSVFDAEFHQRCDQIELVLTTRSIPVIW